MYSKWKCSQKLFGTSTEVKITLAAKKIFSSLTWINEHLNTGIIACILQSCAYFSLMPAKVGTNMQFSKICFMWKQNSVTFYLQIHDFTIMEPCWQILKDKGLNKILLSHLPLSKMYI